MNNEYDRVFIILLNIIIKTNIHTQSGEACMHV
jgi:hypothetical protein